MEKTKSQLRAEFLEEAKGFAARLASEYGCDAVTESQEEFPVKTLADWMEAKCGGDCTTHIVWTGGDFDEGNPDEPAKPQKRVEFRFRLTNPCVSVSLDHRKTLAEIEFSDVIGEEHSGHFCLHATSAWGCHGGMPLLEHIVEEWEEEH